MRIFVFVCFKIVGLKGRCPSHCFWSLTNNGPTCHCPFCTDHKTHMLCLTWRLLHGSLLSSHWGGSYTSNREVMDSFILSDGLLNFFFFLAGYTTITWDLIQRMCLLSSAHFSHPSVELSMIHLTGNRVLWTNIFMVLMLTLLGTIIEIGSIRPFRVTNL